MAIVLDVELRSGDIGLLIKKEEGKRSVSMIDNMRLWMHQMKCV